MTRSSRLLTLSLLALPLLSACQPANTQTASTDIRYFRDTRTKLCFASAGENLHDHSATLTNVPCTPEVMALLK